MPRDNFSQKTINTLAKRVNYMCSNPECRQYTCGPSKKDDKSTTLGVACHINAASPKGARYDQKQSSTERKSITNAIWLCQNHAKLIDNDPNKYTTELLLQWKKDAESEATNQLKGGLKEQNGQIKLSVQYKKNNLTSTPNEHHYELICTMTNHKAVPIKSGYIEVRMPICVATDGFVRPVIDAKDEEFCMFRKHIDSNILYPEESQIVSIHYYMDNDLFKKRSMLYKMPITFKYFDDTDIITEEEKNFGLCQEF